MPRPHPLPLVDEAINLLQRGRFEPYELDDQGYRQLRRSLARLFGTRELVAAVVELCVFAAWLGGRERSPSASYALLRLAEGALDAASEGGTEAAADMERTIELARALLEPQLDLTDTIRCPRGVTFDQFVPADFFPATASATPAICSAPVRTSIVDPAKSSPTG